MPPFAPWGQGQGRPSRLSSADRSQLGQNGVVPKGRHLIAFWLAGTLSVSVGFFLGVQPADASSHYASQNLNGGSVLPPPGATYHMSTTKLTVDKPNLVTFNKCAPPSISPPRSENGLQRIPSVVTGRGSDRPRPPLGWLDLRLFAPIAGRQIGREFGTPIRGHIGSRSQRLIPSTCRRVRP